MGRGREYPTHSREGDEVTNSPKGKREGVSNSPNGKGKGVTNSPKGKGEGQGVS